MEASLSEKNSRHHSTEQSQNFLPATTISTIPAKRDRDDLIGRRRAPWAASWNEAREAHVMREMTKTWNDIPPEIWLLVIEYLPLQDASNLTGMCQLMTRKCGNRYILEWQQEVADGRAKYLKWIRHEQKLRLRKLCCGACALAIQLGRPRDRPCVHSTVLISRDWLDCMGTQLQFQAIQRKLATDFWGGDRQRNLRLLDFMRISGHVTERREQFRIQWLQSRIISNEPLWRVQRCYIWRHEPLYAIDFLRTVRLDVCRHFSNLLLQHEFMMEMVERVPKSATVEPQGWWFESWFPAGPKPWEF